MSSRPTPPRLGFRVPAPPAPRDPATEGEDDGGLRTGDLLDGRYQIEERIGEGGVGVVYRALQLKLHRRVAIKLMQQESDEEQRPRFEREAVTLAALSHPNIVSVQDYGHTRGKPFLVMELLEGRTLRELLDVEGALAVPRALSLTREILHALAYAHNLGIVHRDLKPANLLVQALPSHEHVKVLDFGFVKLLPGSYLDRGVQLSRVGFTFGTPAYMSPEHATGGNVDGRSDLYALGVLLFEMLTGDKPFDGELSDLIRDHLSTPVPWLSSRRPQLAGRDDLQAIVDRAMAKTREDRFPDAGAFLSAIDAILLAPTSQPKVESTAALAETQFVSPAEAGLRSAEPARIDVELRNLGRAVEHFGRASLTIVKRESRPMLERTSQELSRRTVQLRAQAHRVAIALRTRALAFWAWTKPQMARVQVELTRLLKQLQARVQGKIEVPDDSETSLVKEAAPKPSSPTAPVPSVRPPSPNATMVLDDPTFAEDIVQMQPGASSSDSQRMAEQR